MRDLDADHGQDDVDDDEDDIVVLAAWAKLSLFGMSLSTNLGVFLTLFKRGEEVKGVLNNVKNNCKIGRDHAGKQC